MRTVGAFEIGELDDRNRRIRRAHRRPIFQIELAHIRLFPRMRAVEDGIALRDNSSRAAFIIENLNLGLLTALGRGDTSRCATRRQGKGRGGGTEADTLDIRDQQALL